jgi:excisionase family DNA binding protein
MAELRLEGGELESLVRRIVAEVLAELEQHQQIHQGRLAYTEAEAAAMLGLKQHQLRDIRRDGKIHHTRIVGRQIRYTLQDLMAYLNQGRQQIDT